MDPYYSWCEKDAANTNIPEKIVAYPYQKGFFTSKLGLFFQKLPVLVKSL